MRSMMRTAAVLAVVGTLVLIYARTQARAEEAKPGAEKSFTLVSVLVGDKDDKALQSKIWLPSTIIVTQGDRVKLTLKNEVPGAEATHGFAIPGYKIEEIVTRGQPKTVEFTADKPGVFNYICQLHPGHIGGQLEVHPAGEFK